MHIKNKKLRKAYEGSYYTISGIGSDIGDWIDGYEDLLKVYDIGIPNEWIDFTGEEMNEEFNLKGTSKYPNDYQFIAFPLDDLDVEKLAQFKIKNNHRWFDDIINEDLRHFHNE